MPPQESDERENHGWVAPRVRVEKPKEGDWKGAERAFLPLASLLHLRIFPLRKPLGDMQHYLHRGPFRLHGKKERNVLPRIMAALVLVALILVGAAYWRLHSEALENYQPWHVAGEQALFSANYEAIEEAIASYAGESADDGERSLYNALVFMNQWLYGKDLEYAIEWKLKHTGAMWLLIFDENATPEAKKKSVLALEQSLYT